MLEFLKNKKILLVVAHPDDELLGCGATMYHLIHDYGCTVKVVILGEGVTSRSEQRDVDKWKTELEMHRDDIKKAQSIIGYQDVSIHAYPDNRFDSASLLDIVKTIEKEKLAFLPEVVFTHHGGDLNIDHQRTFEAVVTACRPMENETVQAIITFETFSGTEWRASSDPKHFVPNLFFEVYEDGLQAKIDGMASYGLERRSYPHPRSPEALKIAAQRWGIAVGKQYVEAFCVIRMIA